MSEFGQLDRELDNSATAPPAPGERAEVEPAQRSTQPAGAPAEGSEPSDGPYELYREGRDLLAQGDPDAAVPLLTRAVAAEPDARSVRETLARAQFDARMYYQARANFAVIAESDPADHYAHFGLGLTASRLGDFAVAANHLAIASALRPEITHYGETLRQVRATLRHRADA